MGVEEFDNGDGQQKLQDLIRGIARAMAAVQVVALLGLSVFAFWSAQYAGTAYAMGALTMLFVVLPASVGTVLGGVACAIAWRTGQEWADKAVAVWQGTLALVMLLWLAGGAPFLLAGPMLFVMIGNAIALAQPGTWVRPMRLLSKLRPS